MSFAASKSPASAIGSCKIVGASSMERSAISEGRVNGASEPSLRRFSAIGSTEP